MVDWCVVASAEAAYPEGVAVAAVAAVSTLFLLVFALAFALVRALFDLPVTLGAE